MAAFHSDSKFSLLIVEDDKVTRDIMVRMIGLKFTGCTAYSAENGKKGLELYKAHTPDMVITDINMPEMDGIEMARAIRSMDATATYIVLTAYGNENFLEEFKKIGFCDYLMKPIEFNKLFASIERCAAGGKLQE